MKEIKSKIIPIQTTSDLNRQGFIEMIIAQFI